MRKLSISLLLPVHALALDYILHVWNGGLHVPVSRLTLSTWVPLKGREKVRY